jgi:hypothetical protein
MPKGHTPKPTPVVGVTPPQPIVYNDEEYTVATDGSGKAVALIPTAYGLTLGKQVIHL